MAHTDDQAIIDAGFISFYEGIPIEDNPYFLGGYLSQKWAEGWLIAFADLARECANREAANREVEADEQQRQRAQRS